MGLLSFATPRPIIQPSRISILKGSSVQPLPSGTTSTWQMVARYFSASVLASFGVADMVLAVAGRKAHACGQLQRLVQRGTGACAVGCAPFRKSPRC